MSETDEILKLLENKDGSKEEREKKIVDISNIMNRMRGGLDLGENNEIYDKITRMTIL